MGTVMVFAGLLQKLRKACQSIRNYCIDNRLDEATLLQIELEARDRETPGWDNDAYRVTLRRALKEGKIDRRHLVVTYGESMVCEEEAKLKK